MHTCSDKRWARKEEESNLDIRCVPQHCTNSIRLRSVDLWCLRIFTRNCKSVLQLFLYLDNVLKLVKDTWKFDHLHPTAIRTKSHSDFILRASLKNIFCLLKVWMYNQKISANFPEKYWKLRNPTRSKVKSSLRPSILALWVSYFFWPILLWRG